jgi:hypothetical protein
VPSASDPVFRFCPPELIFGGSEGVWFCFQVLRARTYFRRFRGSRPVLIFSAPGLIFGGTERVGSRFQVLLARTRVRRFRGRRILFSFFARPDSFWAVPTASCPVFMFCAPGLVFNGSEGVGSRFHVLLSRTRFRRFRGHRVPFSCLARPNSFSAVPMASGPIFMFCAPGLIFGGSEGVRSRFHVFRSRTYF